MSRTGSDAPPPADDLRPLAPEMLAEALERVLERDVVVEREVGPSLIDAGFAVSALPRRERLFRPGVVEPAAPPSPAHLVAGNARSSDSSASEPHEVVAPTEAAATGPMGWKRTACPCADRGIGAGDDAAWPGPIPVPSPPASNATISMNRGASCPGAAGVDGEARLPLRTVAPDPRPPAHAGHSGALPLSSMTDPRTPAIRPPDTLRQEAPPYGPPRPSPRPGTDVPWPAEKPPWWPRNWPYPPPCPVRDLPPPEGMPPPPALPQPPDAPGPSIGPVGPPPDTVYPIGPGPSARPPPPRPGGVTTVESWTGNCYYCSTEIVDELIDVLNQGGAAGGGGAVLAGLKKYPQLAAIFGGYAAAAVWMGAHINRVRREAARNCRPGETAGVKICIVGVYSTGVWVTVEPYCYVPR